MLSVQERYARGVVQSGGNPKPPKKYPYPTHQQMDALEKHKLPLDVDEKLREPLVKLNNVGYKTWGSCSGHTCCATTPTGWVHIAPHRDDPFLVKLKSTKPDIHACLEPEISSKNYGFSRAQVDPSKAKSIIKRYTDADSVNYQKPIIDRPYHRLTFSALSEEDW